MNRKWAIMSLVLLVLATAPLSDRVRAEGACGDATALDNGRCAKDYTFKLTPTQPDYTFRLEWQGQGESLIELKALTAIDGEGKTLQTIDLSPYEFMPMGPDLTAQDVDFDGDLDLLLLANQGAANEFRVVILFDQPNRRFVMIDDQVGNPVLDPPSKTLVSVVTAGCAGHNYLQTAWRYPDLKATKVREEKQGEITEGCEFFLRQQWSFPEGRPVLVGDAVVALQNMTDEKTLCGPLNPPATCRPVAVAIEFLGAEENRDAQAMVSHYTDPVTWHGESKSRDALLANHRKWVGSLSEYDMSLSNFRLGLSRDDARALVETDVRASYKTNSGKSGSFALRKRLLLQRDGKDWLISCEEDAAYYEGTKGTVTQACQLE